MMRETAAFLRANICIEAVNADP